MSRGDDGKQRNIQKNVNISLFLSSFRDVGVSPCSSGPALPAPDGHRAAACGKSRVASLGGAEPHRRVLVQTNLSCPSQPFWDTPGGISCGSSRQQSNLEAKLRGRRGRNVACSSSPSCLRPVDLGPGGSCSERVCSKSSPKNDFSDRRRCWSQKPGGGLGLCGVPSSCNDTSPSGTGSKDPHIFKHPRGRFCLSEGRCGPLGTAGDSFCPAKLCERPSTSSVPHDERLPPESPARSWSSSSPGPPLTLEHLRSSASAESHATSATLRVLLSSSQVSANLHSSIAGLKREVASMGALSSFPGEPKSFLLPHASRFDPRVSPSGRRDPTEQPDREEGCAKEASVRWRNSFTRDRGLGATTATWEEPHPLGYYGRRDTGLRIPSAEASDPFWPSAFYGGVGSAPLVCRGEEGCSNPSLCYLGCCSAIQPVLEGKGPSGHPKTHSRQKMLDADELSSRFFHPPELAPGGPPLCSFDGLEVSVETLCARPPGTVGVTVDGAQRGVHVMVQSSEVGQLGHGSEIMDLHELQDEPADVDGALPTIQTMEEAALFVPSCNSWKERDGKGLGEHSSAATDGLHPTGFGETASGSRDSSNRDCRADVGLDQGEEPPTEKDAESPTFLRCEGSRHGMDAVQEETPGRNDGATDGERSRVPPQSTLLLAKCFAVWRDRVFGQRAAAQALYERQLLRKGLGALKWAVELRQVQAGMAQRRHSRRVLAASFHRWQDAVARQQKERASQVETEAHQKDSPPVLGREKIVRSPILGQLSAECLAAATQYGRAEGNLWLQIHRNQGGDKLDRKAQAVRDMRRLAAFRLWCLQKERLEEEGSRAREACALLEKNRLRSAFELWRSRHRAAEQIWPLMAQIHRRLVSRCFNTWKGFAEREARGRHSWDRRRVGALRLCFQQWAQMVQLQEQARKALMELLARRREMACARFGFSSNAPKTQPCLNAGRQSQRNGPDTLDGLYVALALQETFYTWKARWNQRQQLDAFCQTAEQKLLRKALGRWCWKALRLPPSGRCARDLAEERLLASLDSDEFSVSSGFHSNAAALPASRDWLERKGSLTGSSRGSVSSSVTITDTGHLLHQLSPSPTPSPGSGEDLGDDAVESWVQASSPLRDQYSGEDGSVSDPFQSMGFLSPECGIHSITASPSGEAASSGGEEAILEDQRQLLARCFALWSSRTLQNWKGKQLCRRRLLSWAFISWSAVTTRTCERHQAQVWLESARQQRLLASCFARWKVGVSRAQEQREEESPWGRPAEGKAVWRWRKAVRGSHALRPRTGTVIQQSSNYWTKAAAFHLCLRERSSLFRASKCMKMPLTWPSKQGRNREAGLPPSLAIRARLNGSAFHVWLVVCRSQSGMAGPSRQQPPDIPGREEWKVKHAEIQSSDAGTDSTRWLWRKYLRLWRHNVLLRRFREAWRRCHLGRAWLLWKDACRTEWVAQALMAKPADPTSLSCGATLMGSRESVRFLLARPCATMIALPSALGALLLLQARQRLAEWGWKAWRRRHLQTWVTEHFLEAQDRSLLKRAFGRWRHLAAKASDQPSQPLSRNTGADGTKVGRWMLKDADTPW